MKTSEFVHGMGIVSVGAPITRHNFLFAITYIRIYDGRSFEIIKQGATSADDEPLMSQVAAVSGAEARVRRGIIPGYPHGSRDQCPFSTKGARLVEGEPRQYTAGDASVMGKGDSR